MRTYLFLICCLIITIFCVLIDNATLKGHTAIYKSNRKQIEMMREHNSIDN